MSWVGYRHKQVRAAKFRPIFECPVCGFDVLYEIEHCPKCLAGCMRWILVLRDEFLANELKRAS